MNHVFVYAIPTSQSKEARISEIAAVRVNGFGPYRKQQVQDTLHDVVSEEDNNAALVITNLYSKMITPEPFVLVSYNIEIVRALLRIENEKTNSDDKFQGRAWIDVNQLAWPLIVSGQIQSRSLESLSTHFGVSIGAHSDSADYCTALLQIYGLMMRRFRTALKGESVVREAGGETLEGLRSLMGF